SFLNFALFLKGGIARPKQQQPVTHTISEIIQFDRWLKRRLHCASADGEWVHQRYTENGRANFLRCSRLDWWSRWDSNPRPPRCHRGALPTAPRPHRQPFLVYHRPLFSPSFRTRFLHFFHVNSANLLARPTPAPRGNLYDASVTALSKAHSFFHN